MHVYERSNILASVESWSFSLTVDICIYVCVRVCLAASIYERVANLFIVDDDIQLCSSERRLKLCTCAFDCRTFAFCIWLITVCMHNPSASDCCCLAYQSCLIKPLLEVVGIFYWRRSELSFSIVYSASDAWQAVKRIMSKTYMLVWWVVTV